MKRIICFVLASLMLLLPVSCSSGDEAAYDGPIKKLTIGGESISKYTIYYPEDANENIKFAAGELVRLLEIATGITVPVKTGEAKGTAIEFAVSDDASLKDDGYAYTVSDGHLKFEVAAARGASNGVWRFLENECGWDFLIYGDSHLNESDHVDIPAGTTATETPAFAYLGLNDHGGEMVNERVLPTSEQANYGTMGVACHGLQNQNFAELDNFINQPCYTDEDTYQLIKGNVEAYIKKRLEAGEKIGEQFKAVDIAQIDTSYFCRCSECSRISRAEGSHSGPVVQFANRLSEELNEKYPGLYYQIFAYQGTNKAPKTIVPNEYVYVTFCYDRNCSNHLVDGSECELNAKYNDWIESWGVVTDNIYVWDYALDSIFNQYTIIDNIYDDFHYYNSLGVDGIYRCGRESTGYGFREIEQMLIVQLNWNMDMTRDEFTELYHKMLKSRYGDGWENILELTDIMNEAQNRMGCWDCWGGHVPEEQRIDIRYYSENFDHILELLGKAEEMTEDEYQLRNIAKLYPAVLYTGCQASYFLEYLEGDEERMAVLEERYAECLERFEALGYDIESLKNLYGDDVMIRKTLEREAWLGWADYFQSWTGQKKPA